MHRQFVGSSKEDRDGITPEWVTGLWVLKDPKDSEPFAREDLGFLQTAELIPGGLNGVNEFHESGVIKRKEWGPQAPWFISGRR